MTMLSLRPISDLRAVRMHFPHSKLRDNSLYYLAVEHVVDFVAASRKLHVEPGINPYSGSKTSPIDMIEIGMLTEQPSTTESDLEFLSARTLWHTVWTDDSHTQWAGDEVFPDWETAMQLTFAKRPIANLRAVRGWSGRSSTFLEYVTTDDRLDIFTKAMRAEHKLEFIDVASFTEQGPFWWAQPSLATVKGQIDGVKMAATGYDLKRVWTSPEGLKLMEDEREAEMRAEEHG